ncbi:MAG: glycosyl transferase [Muribaculaceae bacterium]|nr:glycosyl transferase [Muribaculaceae bacterium]
MIPKIIHFCWLSDDPYPAKIQQCIDSWSQHLPDYEIRKWDFKRFPKDKSDWVREAFEQKKYAFAADYIRNYALYTEGGIYLDSDVEVLKTFDPLLHLPYFFCYENGSGCIEAAVMGSEPGNPIFGKMLKYYEGRHFIKPDGSLDTEPLPRLKSKVLANEYAIKDIDNIEDFDHEPSTISVLPFDFFSPIHIEHRELQSTDRTIAIHRFAASWAPWHKKLKKFIKRLVGPKATKWYIAQKRKLFSPSK